MNTITFPYQINLIKKTEEDYPEHIIVRWNSKEVFESVLVVYEKRTKRDFFFRLKTYYQATNTEYIPGFVGIKIATSGFIDYDYKLEKHYYKPNYYTQEKYELDYSKDVSKIIYNLDTLETIHRTLFENKPIKLKDFWRDEDFTT